MALKSKFILLFFNPKKYFIFWMSLFLDSFFFLLLLLPGSNILFLGKLFIMYYL